MMGLSAIEATISPWRHAERGPVRLVIDLPVRNVKARWAIVGLVAVVASLTLVGIAAVRAALGGPLVSASDGGLVLFVSLVSVGLASFLLFSSRSGATRETLEIDSRFVTLSRSGRVIAIWGRARAGEFHAWELPPDRMVAWFQRRFLDRPTIGWGTEGYLGWTGSGISSDAAIALLGAIRDFAHENPPEPGFDYSPGSMPMDTLRTSAST